MKIQEFQQIIKKNYFKKDNNRGPEKTFLWLTEEVGELAGAIAKNDIENIKEELADVIAWTTSLCNLYDFDLEEVLKKKYTENCIYCNNSPCICKKK